MNPYQSPTADAPLKAATEVWSCYVVAGLLALSVATYFMPFYMPIKPGEFSGVMFGLTAPFALMVLLLGWVFGIFLFISGLIRLWYSDRTAATHRIVASVLIAIVYVIFFAIASQGYVLTA